MLVSKPVVLIFLAAFDNTNRMAGMLEKIEKHGLQPFLDSHGEYYYGIVIADYGTNGNVQVIRLSGPALSVRKRYDLF